MPTAFMPTAIHALASWKAFDGSGHLMHRGSAKNLAMAIGILVILSVIGIGSYLWRGEGPGRAQETAAARERIRICSALPVDLLVPVALAQGFFAQEGVDVELASYPFGREALNALLAGKCDIATVAETPIVIKSFERRDFMIIASTWSRDNLNKIIARKDRGVLAPQDLQGKRIATLKATSAHFFLYMFLQQYDVLMDQVHVVYADGIPETRKALAAGDVDAIAMFEPYIGEIQKELGDNGIVLAAPGLVINSGNLVAMNSFIGKRRNVIEKILRVLVRAQAFVQDNRRAAVASAARVIGASEADVVEAWPDTEVPQVALAQALLLGLEDEARWAMTTGLVERTQMPNYLRFLYLDGLRSVQPDAVTVVQ